MKSVRTTLGTGLRPRKPALTPNQKRLGQFLGALERNGGKGAVAPGFLRRLACASLAIEEQPGHRSSTPLLRVD